MSEKDRAVYDHEGNLFPSITTLLEFYNIPQSTYYKYKKDGVPLNEILERRASLTYGLCKPCKDHLGNEYGSISEMCEKYGITQQLYSNRRNLGWSIKDILTKPVYFRGISETVDHLGNSFASVKCMAEHYGLNEHIVRDRLHLGYSLKDALTIPVRKKRSQVNNHVTDHNGNVFATETAMCSYYNIDQRLYKNRLRLGWSQKDALETSSRVYKRKK